MLELVSVYKKKKQICSLIFIAYYAGGQKKRKKYKEGKLTPQCNLGLGMPFGTQALPRPLTWD